MTTGPTHSIRSLFRHVGRGAGLFTLLLLLQLSSTQGAAAQVPIVLERQQAVAYVPYKYNFTEFSLDVDPGPLAFVANNEGATSSEMWVRQGSRTIWHDTYAAQTIRRIEFENGTYTISINGRGTFALTDISLMGDALSGVPLNVNKTFGDRYATILFSVGDRQFCLRSDAPGDWTLWNRKFEDPRRLDLSNWTRIALEGSHPEYPFYEDHGGRGGNLTVTDPDASGDCKGDQPVAPSPQPTPSSSRGSPGAGFGWALLAAFVVLAWRCERFRRD